MMSMTLANALGLFPRLVEFVSAPCTGIQMEGALLQSGLNFNNIEVVSNEFGEKQIR
jgi:hypothetical protein